MSGLSDSLGKEFDKRARAWLGAIRLHVDECSGRVRDDLRSLHASVGSLIAEINKVETAVNRLWNRPNPEVRVEQVLVAVQAVNERLDRLEQGLGLAGPAVDQAPRPLRAPRRGFGSRARTALRTLLGGDTVPTVAVPSVPPIPAPLDERF